MPIIISPLPITLTNGTTADATQVMTDLNQIVSNVNTNGAENGANSSITSLNGLATPLSIGQGGTGQTTGANAITALTVANSTLGAALNNATSVTIASAATVNIGAALSNNVIISGNTTVTAFDTVAEGAIRFVTYSGAVPITYNGTTMQLLGGGSRVMDIGGVSVFRSLGAGNWIEESYQQPSGGVVGSASTKLPSLTVTLSATAVVACGGIGLDFRSATATSGAVSSVYCPAGNVTIGAGDSLGVVSFTYGTIQVIAMYNAGSPVYGLVLGSVDETQVYSSVPANGGRVTAGQIVTSAGVTVTNSPVRVLGTFTGGWTGGGVTGWTSLTAISPLSSMGSNSLGYGQSWGVQTRSTGVTYYNTTGKPITLNYAGTATGAGAYYASISVNGGTYFSLLGGYASGAGIFSAGTCIIPPGGNWIMSSTNLTSITAFELR